MREAHARQHQTEMHHEGTQGRQTAQEQGRKDVEGNTRI